MKTLIRTIAILYIITVVTAGITFAQTTSGTTTTSGFSEFPERTEKLANETDDSYDARLRAWDTEARRLTLSNEFRTTSGTVQTDSYEQPAKRAGESDDAYQVRIRAWKAELDQQNAKNRQLLDLQKLLESSRNAGSFNTFGSGTDKMLVIPTGEMKTEDLLSINEDMNVMSRILLKELINIDIALPAPVFGALFTNNYGLADTTLNCIFLQGYGALFLIKVGFPLSAPSETAEQPEEPDKEDVDSVWEQTRQQIYQPLAASTINLNTREPDVKYDAQRIENLKTTLIKTLKHAANIRALKPDESVILRISGSGQSINILSVKKDGNQSLVNYESNGIRQLVMISGDLEDYIKSLSTPSVILIRAKKSDIDSFAKGELDIEKFHQLVQIISYPLLQNTLQSATTGRTSEPFGTTGTRTTSSTTGRRTSRTSVVPIQPDNETDNYR